MKHKDEFAKALPPEVRADLFIRVALTAMLKTPKLMDCTSESIMQSLLDLAALGLLPDSVGAEAYIIPYGTTAQLQIGYIGLLKLAYNHPRVRAIRGKVVYAGDEFEYSDGFEPKLVHVPRDHKDGDEIVRAYAIAELAEGARTWVVINPSEWEKARASSKTASRADSPWNLWEEAMILKTTFRKLSKIIPRSRQLVEALAHDADDAVIDVASQVMTQVPTLAAPTEERAIEYPEETTGSKAAAEVRSETNKLTTEQRAELSKEGEAIIAGRLPKKKADPKPAPATDLFVESDEHKALRDSIAAHGVSEAALLEHLRSEGLIDEAVSDIKMIPQKRAATIMAGIETILAEVGIK